MSCNPNATATSRRSAKKLNLVIDQGMDFRLPVIYREDGVAVDLTDATAEATFREKMNSADSLLVLSPGSGTAIDGVDGRITLSILPAQTADLRIYKGVWDLVITLDGGELFRLLYGNWELRRGVTR